MSRVEEIERMTGHPVRWSTTWPVFCALQYHGPRCMGEAGLIWSEGSGFGYAKINFNSNDARCQRWSQRDVVAAALHNLGVVEDRTLPRLLRKSIRAKIITPRGLVA